MSYIPIRINTQHGLEIYNILQEQYVDYFKRGFLVEFRNRCLDDYIIQEKYLEYFLDNDALSRLYPMTEHDAVGFDVFNSQSDVCTCLKYFSGEKL